MNANTVLIVDDNTIHRKILNKILNEKYEIAEADSGASALEVLDKKYSSICAVMLDLVMPKINGLEFLDKIKADSRFSNLPVIVTTGNDRLENEIEALRRGAWDFVSKPYNPDIILLRLESVIARSQVSALKKLKYLYEFDELTGIYNKNSFCKMTRKMLNENPDTSFVLMRIDIDRFKLINSYYGKQEGDKLLFYMAKAIRWLAQQSELSVYGRMESDVFAMCIPYNAEELTGILDDARKQLKGYWSQFDVVPSVGLYVVDDIEMSVENMLDRANLAAKMCKGSYLKCYAFYEKEMSVRLEKEQLIINEMSDALANGQFEVFYQPKYKLQTNQPYGAEALVRWFHPQKGMLLPEEFTPIFEANGFISKMDYYVWERVCADMKSWIDEGLNVLPVSVNVSRANLLNPRLVEIICGLTEKYNIPPHLFNLELTASAYMDNPQVMSDIVNKLRELGYAVILDNFGSGHFSLSMLNNITVDMLKIDMKFFSHTKGEGQGENIVAAVVRMAKWLRLPITIQGIEEQSQVDFLRSIGCEYVQGFYFAKPVTDEEIHKLLIENSALESESKESSFKELESMWSSFENAISNFCSVKRPIAVCIVEDGNITMLRANEAYYNSFGYNVRVFETNYICNQLDAKFCEKIKLAVDKCINKRMKTTCEYCRMKKDGTYIWVRIAIKFMMSLSDKALICMAPSDITQKKTGTQQKPKK